MERPYLGLLFLFFGLFLLIVLCTIYLYVNQYKASKKLKRQLRIQRNNSVETNGVGDKEKETPQENLVTNTRLSELNKLIEKWKLLKNVV